MSEDRNDPVDGRYSRRRNSIISQEEEKTFQNVIPNSNTANSTTVR